MMECSTEQAAFQYTVKQLEDAEAIKRFHETHVCHTCANCEEPGDDEFYEKIGWCTEHECFVDPMKSPAQVDCECLEGF